MAMVQGPKRARPRLQGDPFRTLFVSRLSYDVNEKRLRKEFEQYGPIKRVRIVTDKNGGARAMHAAPHGHARACRGPPRPPLLLPPTTPPPRRHAGKSRGYGFIEFEDKKDMKEAYKAADGRKIEARRVLVDVERGRTVETW